MVWYVIILPFSSSIGCSFPTDTHIEADGSDDSPDSVEEKTCLTSKPISPLMSPEMLIRK